MLANKGQMGMTGDDDVALNTGKQFVKLGTCGSWCHTVVVEGIERGAVNERKSLILAFPCEPHRKALQPPEVVFGKPGAGPIAQRQCNMRLGRRRMRVSIESNGIVMIAAHYDGFMLTKPCDGGCRLRTITHNVPCAKDIVHGTRILLDCPKAPRIAMNVGNHQDTHVLVTPIG